MRLAQLVEPGMAEVWVKLEGGEPDRVVQGPHGAGHDRGGRTRRPPEPGQRVVEYTGGSTGSSLAFVCAVKGYPLQIVTSDAFADEKLRTMEAFGARLEVLPSPEGITPELIPRMRARAAELAAELGAFQTDQFRNTDMVDGYRRLGEEPVEQVPGTIDAMCIYVGTAGCFLGVGRALRSHYPALDQDRRRARRVRGAVGRAAGHPPHRGRRGGVPARAPRPDDFDDVVAVPTADAFAMARLAPAPRGSSPDRPPGPTSSPRWPPRAGWGLAIAC